MQEFVFVVFCILYLFSSLLMDIHRHGNLSDLMTTQSNDRITGPFGNLRKHACHRILGGHHEHRVDCLTHNYVFLFIFCMWNRLQLQTRDQPVFTCKYVFFMIFDVLMCVFWCYRIQELDSSEKTVSWPTYFIFHFEIHQLKRMYQIKKNNGG